MGSTKACHSSSRNVLNLHQSHVKFDQPDQKVSVFFDECNREIVSVIRGISVQSSSSPMHQRQQQTRSKVIFQATDRLDRAEFLLAIEKRILSIKFNSLRSILAYHVEKSNIEFINVRRTFNGSHGIEYVLDDKRYIQASRSKNSKLFGFIWTGPLELVMITDISIEYYHVDSSRRRLKFIKSFPSTTNWFVYQPSAMNFKRNPPIFNEAKEETTYSDGSEMTIGRHSDYSILMVSTGSAGNSMQPYMFREQQILKLQRFDVDNFGWQDLGEQRSELLERSVTIGSIYNQVRLLVLQHESLNLKSKGAQVLIYTINSDTGATSKTHTLDLDVNGRFAINIVDNLIVAHDQPSKSSFIFDIMIESTEKSDCPKHYVSLIGGQIMRMSTQNHGKLQHLGASTSCSGHNNATSDNDAYLPDSAEMYSLDWVFFQPNFIIDAKLGLLSTIQLNLNSARESIMKHSLVFLNFLAHRKHSEQIILNECRKIVEDCFNLATKREQGTFTYTSSSLNDVSLAFDIISKLIISAPEAVAKGCRNFLATNDKKQSAQSNRAPCISTPALVYNARLAQEDIYREVLKQLTIGAPSDNGPPMAITAEDDGQLNFICSVLIELIFAIRRQDKNVDFCIYEQLFKCLVRGKRFYQIVQMIRSDILKDSKHLACLLLSIRAQYPPSAQMGLDMLQRLDYLDDLIESLNLVPIHGQTTIAATPSSSGTTSDTTSRLSVILNQSLEVDAKS